MRALEKRLEKLERLNQINGYSREEVMKVVDELEDVHPLEKAGILVDLGLLEGETIARTIAEGYEKKKTNLENRYEE